MPRNSERGGPQTRARILEIANPLFLERGFDAVTVAEVAREAGVSSVTVFKHFPTKEDLFLDRAGEATDLLRSTIRGRSDSEGVVDALERLAFRLVDEGSPLSGTNALSAAFFRTVAGSPALIARTRQIGGRLETVLREEFAADDGFSGDGSLLAVFFVAGYGSVLVETAARLMAGTDHDELVRDHRRRLTDLFAALRSGVAAD